MIEIWYKLFVSSTQPDKDGRERIKQVLSKMHGYTVKMKEYCNADSFMIDPAWMQKLKPLIVTFDVTEKGTYTDLQRFLEVIEVSLQRIVNYQFYLVGDISGVSVKNQRQVSFEEAS